MQINHTNYEPFLLDYLDGNLGPVEVAELLLFMEQNPKIKAEFEGLESGSFLVAETDKYPDKEALKRAVNIDSTGEFIQNLMLRKIEKDLTKEESIQFDKLVQENEQVQKEFSLFEKTILQADFRIKFPEKKSLKRGPAIIPLFYKVLAVAAIFIFMLALPFLLHYFKNKSAQPTELANQTTEPENRDASLPMLEKKNAVAVQKQKIPATKKHPNSIERSATHTAIAEPMLVSVPNTVQEPVTNQLSIDTVLFANTLSEGGKEPASTAISDAAVEIAPEATESEAPTYLTLNGMMKKKIKSLGKENLEEKNHPASKSKEQKITGWDIAALCARVLSKASGEKIKLQNQYDSEGQLKQYAIVSENFEFSKSR